MSKNFLKNFSIYGIGGTLSRFVGVITAPIYTRLLSTEGYGLLDLITSISAILIIFATMEMHSGYARSFYEAKDKNKLNQLRGTVMSYFLGSFLLLFVVFIILIPFLNKWIKLFDVLLLVPVVLGLLPSIIITLTLITIQFEKKPVLFSLITIGNLVLTAGCGIFAVTYLELGISGILWSNTIVSFLVVFILFIALFKYTRFNFNMTYLKEIALYSVPIVPAVLGSWVNNYIGRIFIASALSLSMLGIYSIAFKVCLLMVLAGGAFRQTWSPKANELFTQKGSESQFADVLNYYLFGFSLLVIIIVSASPIIVRILAPEEFYPAIGIVGILTVGLFWNGTKDILGSGNNWDRKTYYNSIASISGGIVNIFILYFFIKVGGIFSVAIAYTLSAIIQAVLLLYTSQKNHYIPYSYFNLFISFILLTGFSIVSYYSYNSFGLLGFVSFQIPIGILMLGTMYFIFFNSEERSGIVKIIGASTYR